MFRPSENPTCDGARGRWTVGKGLSDCPIGSPGSFGKENRLLFEFSPSKFNFGTATPPKRLVCGVLKTSWDLRRWCPELLL